MYLKNLDLELVPAIKKTIRDKSVAEWKNSPKNKGDQYAKLTSTFPKSRWFNKFQLIDRRDITKIIRMRTGHYLTASYLYPSVDN